MGSSRRRSRRFLCFGIAAGAVDGDHDCDDDDEAFRCKNTSAKDGGDTKRRRRLRLVFSRFLKLEGSRRVPKASQSQKDSSLEAKSLSEKKTLISDDDETASEPIFSSSASSSSSSSSSSTASSTCSSTSSPTSCLLFSASTSPAQPAPLIVRRKRMPARKLAPVRRKRGPFSGLCLLLVSLTVTVFCGRICAILWTSAWLCLAHCRSLSGGRRLPDCDEMASSAERGVREEAGGV